MLDLFKGPVRVLGGERLVHRVEELSKVKQRGARCALTVKGRQKYINKSVNKTFCDLLDFSELLEPHFWCDSDIPSALASSAPAIFLHGRQGWKL